MLVLRICITMFLLAIISLFLLSFTVSGKLTDDIWKQLGLTQTRGTEKIKTSFLNNYFDAWGAKNAKNILKGDRAAVAKDLLTYVKQYVNSAEFKTEYEKMRSSAKPVEPVTKVRTKEEIRKQMIEDAEKGIKKTEEFIKTANAEMKEAMKPVVEMHKANLKEYKDPNSQMIEIMYQGEVMNEQNRQRQYKENMKTWENNYPDDYKLLVKSRLQKYLELAKTVDFSAALVEKDGKKRFVNSKYEGKANDWKTIYRAGKEVYDVAKLFAEQWLREL
jgi:hypothetical protein